MSILFIFGRAPGPAPKPPPPAVKGVSSAIASGVGTGLAARVGGVSSAKGSGTGTSRPAGTSEARASGIGAGRLVRGVSNASAVGSGTAPVGQVWSNGFTWAYEFRRRAIPGLGTVTNQPLPFAVANAEWKSAANGGRVQSSIGRDIRFESGAGKLPHVLVGYDPATGLIPGLLVVPSCNWEVEESYFLYVGKAGLGASEENAAAVAAAGVLFIHTGAGTADFTGQGRTFTTNVGVTAGLLAGWPAGFFDGLSSYRSRVSAEMDALPGLTYFILLRGDEPIGRVMEAFNIALTTSADLALAVNAAGAWVQAVNAGSVRSLLVTNTGFYVPGRAHAVSGVWSSGTAQDLLVDAAAPTLASAPGVASGVTGINDELEIGRGNRPSGAATYWNGPIGLFFAITGRLPAEARKAVLQAMNDPQALFGIGEGNQANDANRSPVAMPVLAAAVANVESLLDVVAASYDQNADVLTPSLPSPVSTGVARLVGGKVGYKPNVGTGGETHSFPYRVADAAKGSTGLLRVLVGAGGAVSTGLPAGYPTPPSFAGAASVSVSTPAELQAAINSAPLTGAGRVIVLAAGVNYGTVTINRSTARIKLVCNTPRFSGLITDRATLDSINLTVTSNTDPVVVNNCIPGGLRAHSATARVGLSVTRCGILWVEGLDFHDPHKLMVNRTSSTTQGCDQLWVRRCSFSESDTNLIGLGGTGGRGADVFVAWENYLFGDGTRADPGQSGTATGGVWTDYPMQFYTCGDLFIYKCIFHGGSNHSISTKLACGPLRVDDCVFANYHPNTSSWKNMELGQEGSPTGNDRTCRLTTVKGCTFTAATGTTKYNVAMLKDVTGLVFDGNIVYDGPGGFLDVRPAPDRSGPNDQVVLAGSQGILIQNNLFGRPGALAQPGACNLDVMYTDSGGGYVFTARNNQYSAVRAVNILARARTRVSTSYGPNPGFSG